MKSKIINNKKYWHIIKLFVLLVLTITLLIVPLIILLNKEMKIVLSFFYLFSILLIMLIMMREFFLYSGKYYEDSTCIVLRKRKKEYVINKNETIILNVTHDDNLHRLPGKEEVFVIIRIKHHKECIPIRIVEEGLIQKLLINYKCIREPSDYLFDWEKTAKNK